MAKLTTQQFIDDHLGGASQYDEVKTLAMLDQFVARATRAADADLMNAGCPAYSDLDARQQGVYNRTAAELVWLQLKAYQAGTDTDRTQWAKTLGMLENAFMPRGSLLGGTQLNGRI